MYDPQGSSLRPNARTRRHIRQRDHGEIPWLRSCRAFSLRVRLSLDGGPVSIGISINYSGGPSASPVQSLRSLQFPMKLEPVDLGIIIAYNVVVLAMGIGFFRRTKTSDQFMAAGRNLPGWAVGLSIFGSYVSSISFLANPGVAYKENWNAALFAFSMPVASWIAVTWFVPFYRKSGEVSAYTHLEHRFGAWARTYAVVCYLLMQLARLGTILYLLALAINPLIGGSMTTLIVVLGVVVIVYPFLGGTEAVIWTGVLQALILIAGAGACVYVLLTGMPEGPGQIVDVALDARKFQFGQYSANETRWTDAFSDFSLAAQTFWVVMCYGLVEHLRNFGVDQAYVQRYITAKSDAAARRSIWLGTVLFMPISLTFFFIGTALYAFYKLQPGLLPADLPADKVFPHFIAHQLPDGLTGLVIAAICAAAMDSNLNSCATLTLEDLYLRYVRPQASEKESVWVLRWSVVILGVLSIVAGVAMQRFESALKAWWQLAGIFGGGVLGLFLLGLMRRQAGNLSALTGVACGVLTIVWMTFSPKLDDSFAAIRSPFHGFMIPVVGTGVILIVGLLVSLVEKPTPSRSSS